MCLALFLACLLSSIACGPSSPTPAPTPTTAPPVTLGCDATVPEAARSAIEALLHQGPTGFVTAADAAVADVRLGSAQFAGAQPLGAWYYALAAPFYTVDDGVALGDLQAAWRSGPAGALEGRSLIAGADTVRVFTALWGAAGAGVRTAEPAALLTEAQQTGAWAILPFDELQPAWKVLRIDGVWLIEKDLSEHTLASYPLQVPLALAAPAAGLQPGLNELLGQAPARLCNRSEGRMTIVAMTGTSCISRTTAWLMMKNGLTYPARDIKDWLVTADLTHVSHESSFTPDCPIPPIVDDSLVFCSHDSYIKLLEEVGVDIVELTGNHLLDYGPEPLRHTLELYRARGWQWYGGGANLAEAQQPLLVTHGPNRLAFLGCNPVGPSYDWATDSRPGSCPCDYARMQAQIRELRAQGYLPIVTFQYLETYEYWPTAGQVADMRAMADAGAVVVQGSQAHQPQAMELRSGAFIHYGLGNLFFDMMQTLPIRQQFVDRLVFYDGRLLAVDLRTAMLEEYGRPRPMTADERRSFLQAIFAVRP